MLKTDIETYILLVKYSDVVGWRGYVVDPGEERETVEIGSSWKRLFWARSVFLFDFIARLLSWKRLPSRRKRNIHKSARLDYVENIIIIDIVFLH